MPKFTATYTKPEAVAFIESHLRDRLLSGSPVTVEITNEPHNFAADGYKTVDMNGPVPQSVLIQIVNGNLIGAIKEYRAYAQVGLKDAKDFVENVKQNILRK